MRARSGTDAIRVGLIGHGDAGAFIHGPLIEAAGGYRIVGVSTSRAKTLARRRDGPRLELDPQGLIEADDVDLIVVATPNHTHHRYARAALMAGKSVVVEKPFVTLPDQARDLVALSKATGLTLTVFHNRRLDGDYRCVRDALISRALGEPTEFEARWDLPPGQRSEGWRAEVETGGGVQWDLGSHLVDQTLQLFGEPLSCAGRTSLTACPSQSATTFEMALRYPGGLTCRLSAGPADARPRPRFRLTGTQGSLTIPAAELYDPAIRSGRHPSDPDFWSGADLPSAELVVDGVRREVLITPPRWSRFYPRLAVALQDRTPPDVTAEQACRVVVLIDALQVGREPAIPHPSLVPQSTQEDLPCRPGL